MNLANSAGWIWIGPSENGEHGVAGRLRHDDDREQHADRQHVQRAGVPFSHS